jgi:membrane protease subunit HflK
MYLDMMQTIIGNSSKVLVDQKVGSQSLLYLPLDKLIQQSTAAASGAPDASAARPPAAPAAEPPGPLDASRSRDALRARDRGSDAR